MEDYSEVNLEESFQNLFKTSVSGTGEEELLRIASSYSLQLTAPQIKCLLVIESIAQIAPKQIKNSLLTFVRRWLELKQHNNSDDFVMKALEYISLRKFFNEQSFKVNIEK